MMLEVLVLIGAALLVVGVFRSQRTKQIERENRRKGL